MSRAHALLLALACAPALGLRTASGPGAGPELRVVEAPADDATLAYRRGLPEARPPLRGYRAPILEDAATARPFTLDASSSQALREGVGRVVSDLAREGLCATLVRLVDDLGPDAVVDGGADAVAAGGLPVDLLAFFEWDGTDGDRSPDAFVRAVAERLDGGTSADELAAELAGARFAYRPTGGFRAASESGEHDAHTVRLQLTRGDTWLGDGDGGNLDLARHVVEGLPDAQALVSVEGRYLDELRETLAAWDLGDTPERLTLVVEPLTVAQWAQDNGKAGSVPDGAGGRVVATLVPRYACRGEGGSIFVPGETFLADGLAAAGHAVVQSPLLFQGGNLLVARDPARDERVLLVGEAEVYRNVGLGLTADQALEALRVELGVDRCVVLPAASFHVDAEVTLRSHGGELLAFVHDDRAAIGIVLEEAAGALERAEALAAPDAERARAALASGDGMTAIQVLGGALGANAVSIGVYSETFARTFATGPTDPGPPNLQSFLLALDRLTGEVVPVEQVPDRHAQAYLRALGRAARDRAAIHAELERNGWRLVRVPSLPGGARGRNYLNALHDRTRTLVPVYGGLYERLDRAALETYERALGPAVTLVPIPSAESQRRSGAVHCSAALYTLP